MNPRVGGCHSGGRFTIGRVGEQGFEIRRLGAGDVEAVLDAAVLFDATPRRDWTEQFLTRQGHHLLIGYLGDTPVGFISGVETVHPDKGVEMFVYELGVDEPYRRRGIAGALVGELLHIARTNGCYGMWVPTETDNEAALATYRAAGAQPPEEAVTLTWSFTT